jgi:predicted MPP superfamily phosphohydrolase
MKKLGIRENKMSSKTAEKKYRIPVGILIILLILAALLILTGVGLYDGLKTTRYSISDTRISADFDGFKIAHISDLHSLWFGEGQSEIIEAVAAEKPDIIVLTGDIVDAYRPDFQSVAALFDGLNDLAPVYAVQGNHEDHTRTYKEMNILYEEYGIVYLNDSGVSISRNGSAIYLYGLRDRETASGLARAAEKAPALGGDTYGILLYHRSDMFDQLKDLEYGLVLSGHMHGGLIRIPFFGGIITPKGYIDFGQKYDGGKYTVNGTTLISNRGLAPKHNMPRIFNRPEVVFVTLHCET